MWMVPLDAAWFKENDCLSVKFARKAGRKDFTHANRPFVILKAVLEKKNK